MDVTPETLTAFALQLSAGERAQLAEALLSSLEPGDADLDAEWLAEAERRDRELERDPTSGRPASSVFAAARAALAGEQGGRRDG